MRRRPIYRRPPHGPSKCTPQHHTNSSDVGKRKRSPPHRWYFFQVHPQGNDLSPNGAPCESPGHRPGNVSQKKDKPCKGDTQAVKFQAQVLGQKNPTHLFRPCRACHYFTAQTQGDALGFHIAPRWGWEGVIPRAASPRSGWEGAVPRTASPRSGWEGPPPSLAPFPSSPADPTHILLD